MPIMQESTEAARSSTGGRYFKHCHSGLRAGIQKRKINEKNNYCFYINIFCVVNACISYPCPDSKRLDKIIN